MRGEPLKIIIPVFYLHRDIKIDWSSIEKNNFKPFSLAHWQVGRHGIESPEYKLPGENFDFQELIIFLDTGKVKNPVTVLQGLRLDYEIKGIAKKQQSIGEDFKIYRTNIRINNGISQQLVRIGDRFNYWIKIARSPGVSLDSFKPEEIDFSPFKVIEFSKKSRNLGSYNIDEYLWTLASYFIFKEPVSLPNSKFLGRKPRRNRVL